MNVKLFVLAITLIVLFLVIDQIRRQKMTFKYSLAWFFISLVVLFSAVFEKSLYRVAFLAGFKLPSNFIFFLLFVFFILLSLFLTLYINEQNSRSETLAQTVAILEFKLKELENRIKRKIG